jgi:K(+)-stimulated pyrophosphate-energized sodium pump
MSPVRLLAQEASADVEFGSGEHLALFAIMAVCLLALLVAFILVRQVLAADQGTDKMREIARAIQEGSRAYLSRQFRTVAVFVALLFFLLLLLEADSGAVRIGRSAAFLVGAVFSALAGYTGMNLAVRANVRVAAAADQGGLLKAMPIAFRAGGVAGMFVVGLGLLGAAGVVLVFQGDAASVLFGFGFGAALLAMFMRVGGGIFTKAADVGADLVGKVEQSIPEDDPRNAATIADNVGDNVGDCAGMAADLFESFEVTLVAAIVLGLAAFPDRPEVGLLFPLVVQAIGIVSSIVGIYLVRPRSETESGMRTINRGFFASAGISLVLVAIASIVYVKDWRPVAAVALGLALSTVIQLMTSYYTATEYKPVQEIAEASETGPATTILAGFSTGLEASVYAILAVAGAIVGAVIIGSGEGLDFQLYMISLAGMGMLTTVGVVVSMDTFGPISDNAQGIAEMSGDIGPRGAEVLTSLDAVGNTTKAITKGVAIATAVLAATSLFGSFRQALLIAGVPLENVDIPIEQPSVMVGLLIGGSVAFSSRPWRSGPSGGPRAGGVRGPQAVPRAPRDHDLRRAPRLWRRGRHLHQGLAARAADPGAAGGAGPDRHRVPVQVGRPRRLPGRRHPHRAAAGRHAVGVRGGLGQRQEVRRGRPPRRQELRAPQGDRDRRHRRRPVQGHRRPGTEPPDQGDEPGRGADRPDCCRPLRRRRAAVRDRPGGGGGARLGAVALQPHGRGHHGHAARRATPAQPAPPAKT